MKIIWQINIREDGLTLLEAVSLRVPAAPRGFLRNLCKKGRISRAADCTDAEQQVFAGEEITISASERFLEFMRQSQLHPAQVLYEDRDCVAIDKPAGLATHRAKGHDDNLLSRVHQFYRQRGEKFQIAPIQRLDLGTSGVILFGKGRSAISALGKAMIAGSCTKRYFALVYGQVTKPKLLTSSVRAKGTTKHAETSLQPIEVKQHYTLLELALGTGRQHQIRQQLAQEKHPVVGDHRYGGEFAAGLDRLFLHCHYLAFPHPATGQQIEVECPLHKTLSAFLDQLD